MAKDVRLCCVELVALRSIPVNIQLDLFILVQYFWLVLLFLHWKRKHCVEYF